MNHWLGELRDDLHRLEAEHSLRAMNELTASGRIITRNGRELINLAGNDYLALCEHPKLKQAAIQAIEQCGTGTGASRLVTGHQSLHARVEAKFAAFKHAQSALLLPTGFMANLAAIGTLAQPGDLICQDKLNHASLIDAANASGATVRTYPHLQLGKLERLLKNHCDGATAPPQQSLQELLASDDSSVHQFAEPAQPLRDPAAPARRFIVTDSVFSMDGDCADLPALCDLAEQYDAILIVDEAHATGVLGEHGTGLCELQGVSERVSVVISTASKALGGMGGVVTGPQVVIDTLINRARPFIYTTGIAPALAATLEAALEVVQTEPQRRARVIEIATQVNKQLARHNPVGNITANAVSTKTITTPIVPIITGTPESAIALSNRLADAGFFAAAIRPPTVAPGTSRIRLTVRADLEDRDIDRLIDVLRVAV